MLLASLRDVEKVYGERHLLRGVSLDVAEKDRIGLVGPNGSGKSTLLRILAGAESADEGTRTVRRGVRIGHLEQEPHLEAEIPVRDAVRAGLVERDTVLAELDVVHKALGGAGDSGALLRRQAELEDRLALLGGHDVEHRVLAMIHSFGLADPGARCGSLSGGERRRVALARILVGAPDLLLLDEPTNHLDAIVVEWLEDRLLLSPAAIVMVTHDRYFLDRVADNIVELDRGELFATEGGYDAFLAAREARLGAERKEERARLSLLRHEREFLRRGPPAQRTKGRARKQRYEALEAGGVEAAPAPPDFTIPEGPRLGTKVVRLEGVSKWSCLRRVDLEIGRGERIGIVGRNGAGKTTLLRLATGELPPDEGVVEIGPSVRFATVDQARSGLQANRSVLHEVGDGSAWVRVGERDVRVESFLEAFLFPRPMFGTPVAELSGGERNRVLLAKLLLRGGNVLVLDEPTNDLDLMTLRVLEEALLAFGGTVLLVSHDRFFLDRVATRIVYLDGKGGVRLHAGDVSGLLERMHEEAAPARRPRKEREEPARERRLAWKEQKELEAIPDTIAEAEADLARADAELADPALYAGPEARVRELAARRADLAARIEALYARWQELDG